MSKDIKKIYLEADDFKSLISGKIISRDGVEVALSDIGYTYMMKIIMDELDK